jgi:hypothetical protein
MTEARPTFDLRDYLARRERDKQEAREMAELEKPREPEVQEDEDNG